MTSTESLDIARHRFYAGMLVTLLALLALIFAEGFRHGWACELTRCPSFIMGGNPFLAVVISAALVLAGLLALLEARIDREGLEGVSRRRAACC